MSDGWEARMAQRATLRRMVADAEEYANASDKPCGCGCGGYRWLWPAPCTDLHVRCQHPNDREMSGEC